ncbi:hypothetical protein LSH36_108g02014 [Paralvinella palmiformis]|uniref:Globin domain-containing protein n=1 Tax=Paralvinella palmiformis TaxID=53620 RepID=A0AAD9JYN5_9ANNE|nr:hypothetical protein LSH36_108g02014 [Paralvinella palmiformis]
MGYIDDIGAVRGNVTDHAVNIFVLYFKQFPQHQDFFEGYKGKDPDSLKSVAKFKGHVTKVTSMLLDILEKTGDAGALQKYCDTLAKMSQHKGLGATEFKDLGTVVVSYVKQTLGGSCDAAGWESAFNTLNTKLGPML